MRLMVVTIAIACVSHLVDATHAATMGAALDAGARAVSSNAVGAFARAVELAKRVTTGRTRCGLNGFFCEEDLRTRESGDDGGTHGPTHGRGARLRRAV